MTISQRSAAHLGPDLECQCMHGSCVPSPSNTVIDKEAQAHHCQAKYNIRAITISQCSAGWNVLLKLLSSYFVTWASFASRKMLCCAQLHQAELPSSYMYTGPVTSTSPAAVMATLRSTQKGPPLLPTQNPSIPLSVSPPYSSPLSCATKLEILQNAVNIWCQAQHGIVVYADKGRVAEEVILQ